MNKLALLVAVLLTLIAGRSADASTLYNFTFFNYSYSPTYYAYGTFTTDDSSNSGTLIAATGDIDGSSITGFGGDIIFMPQRYFVTFTIPDGSVEFSDRQSGFTPSAVIYNSAGVATSTIFGEFDYTAVTPLPASAPLFGLALLVLAAFGFATKRSKPLVTADGSAPY